MNGVGINVKKQSPCRYWINNQTCFYGDDCQFVHADPPIPHATTGPLMESGAQLPPQQQQVHPMAAVTIQQQQQQQQVGQGNLSVANGFYTLPPPPPPQMNTNNSSPHHQTQQRLQQVPPGIPPPPHAMPPGVGMEQSGGRPRAPLYLRNRPNGPGVGMKHPQQQHQPITDQHGHQLPHGSRLTALMKNHQQLLASADLEDGDNNMAYSRLRQYMSPSEPDLSTMPSNQPLVNEFSAMTMSSSHSANNSTAPSPVPGDDGFQQNNPSQLSTPSPYSTNSGNFTDVMSSPKPSTSPSPTFDGKNNAGVDPASTPLILENVGGTTYFYTQSADGMVKQQNPTYFQYPGVSPSLTYLRLRPNTPSFFATDEIRMELLSRQAQTLATIDPGDNSDIPEEVETYQDLYPIDPPSSGQLRKSSTFSFFTSCFKAVNTKDGQYYCLRRIHGFRPVDSKCMVLVDMWKKLQHSNIVQLREMFSTKAFSEHSLIFVHDYHPGCETLMSRHFSHPAATTYSSFSNMYINVKNANRKPTKNGNNPRHHIPDLLPEKLIWNYIIQLSSALRTIHASGLACRVMDPTKILVDGKCRLRVNCVGVFDVLTFDASHNTPLSMMPHYQQEDLVSLGKVVLALACNSLVAIQRENMHRAIELVALNYSEDLKNLLLYLLTTQQRLRSINDIMPIIGARFYTQLESQQLRNDILEEELSKEVQNGRLFRILVKLGTINERPEFNLDQTWSETGDRYLLKLLRDYLFHQVDEEGTPWIDMSHVVQCLNKLDAGIPQQLCLSSRDEQTLLVVSYADLKQCLDQTFQEILHAQQTQAQS